MDMVEKDTKIKCTLCGAVFEPSDNTCGGCIVRKECKLICCPNCGFGIPGESRLVNWFGEKRKKQRSE
jgi:ribosomal protein L37E